MGNIVMFCILAVVIIASALLCVTTTKIMRAATFMLFVLFGVAGIYFLLDYTFLGAAQISVYAGGVTMIYILCSQRWRSSVQSAKTRPGADCGSYHELLIAKFRLKSKKVGKTTTCIGEGHGNPVFLPGESQGRGSLVGSVYGVTQSRT